MNKEGRPALTGEAQTSYLLRREAARKAAASGSSSSPLAMEATLARHFRRSHSGCARAV
jgi:hypothetical protein